jgi:hypothetical protein
MPKKRGEPLSRAEEGVSVEESSSVMEEIPQVETWTTQAGGMIAEETGGPVPPPEIAPPSAEAPPTGEIVAAAETWTTPAREMTLGQSEGPIPETVAPLLSVEAPPTGEVMASVESWTLPVEENWVPTPDELWPLPPGGIPAVDAESEMALEILRHRP